MQAIAGATASIDALPWDSGVALQTLSAADGNYDTSREGVSGALDSNALSPGKHLIYVQGGDASGAKGPPSAAFVEIAAASEISTVQGQVRDALDGHPLVAKVRAHDANQDYTAPTASDGSYIRTAHPGSVSLDVSAPGYFSQTRSNVTLMAGATRQQDFGLYPYCSLFNDDVESGTTNWTAQSPWGVSNVSGNTTHVWTDSPNANYANNRNVSLTSRSFNFSGYADVTLNFDHKCATENGYDFGHVEISTDAAHTAWTEVYRCSGQATWQNQSVALPPAAGVADARLRFRFTSNQGTVAEGWSVDNIRLSAGGASCAAVYASDEIFPDGFGG